MNFFFLLYNAIVLPLLFFIFHILGLFDAKIRRGIKGRKRLFAVLEKKIHGHKGQKGAIIIHAASMGEYEQARPILRLLQQEFPQYTRVLSLFSPSAYDNIAEPAEAEVVTYLPFDSLWACRRFLHLIQPRAILITRHDLWPNLLWEAKRRGIFTLLFDGSVHEGSLRHKPVVKQFNRAVFRGLDAICSISEKASQGMAKFISPGTQEYVVGDTRFDQVVYRAREKSLNEILPPAIIPWQSVLVAGSTWPEDEAVVLPAFARLCKRHPGAKLILVAHEPTEAHLQLTEEKCRDLYLQTIRLSNFTAEAEAQVLVVDRIGVLANLYAAGQVAFVGGSFGPGVHSVIEAAAHGVPVLFGPAMRNSAEAIDMVAEGCGFVIEDAESCHQLLNRFFGDPGQLPTISTKAETFVKKRTGASARVVAVLAEQLQKHRAPES